MDSADRVAVTTISSSPETVCALDGTQYVSRSSPVANPAVVNLNIHIPLLCVNLPMWGVTYFERQSGTVD